ncbi:MAG: OsmC domain/YcaO domain-containing protein, partial [Orrella sp.]
QAQDLVSAFLQYNDNTVDRRLFYQAVSAVLEILLDDDLVLDDYTVNLRRMFSDERMGAVLGSIDGTVKFYGLTPISPQLEGLERHQRLLDSYRKLQAARAKTTAP